MKYQTSIFSPVQFSLEIESERWRAAAGCGGDNPRVGKYTDRGRTGLSPRQHCETAGALTHDYSY